MSRATGLRYRRRRATDVVAKVLGVAATAFGLFWLAWILIVTLRNGLHA
jgi:hypothetical protein